MENSTKQQLLRNDFFLRSIYSKYLIASVLAMLATSVAGMIDTVIVGRFLGETGLAAMSLVSPVYLIYYTIGAVIGMGGSIAANLAIGRNDYAAYRRIFTLAFWTTAVLCVVTTAGGLLFLDPLVRLLGGEGVVGSYLTDYLRWYILGGSFTLFIYIPLHFLKMEGKPQTSSFLFLLSSGLNIAFTYLFMSPVCNMGIKGASIATGLSMGITALLGLYILFQKTPNTRLVKMRGFSFRTLGEIIACGSPNGCNNLFNALKILVINAVILQIGADVYLSAFAMLKSVSDLLTGVVTGVASALMPVVGVFYGERDWNSIRHVCRKALQIGSGLTVLLSLFVVLFAGLLCTLFNITDPVTVAGGQRGLVCLAVSFLFAFVNLMLSGYFNTVKRPMLSNLILALRLLGYLAPAAAFFALWLGIDGVWLSLIAADVLTLGTMLLVIGVLRRKNPKLDWYLLDTSLESESEISFSVQNTLDDVMFASNKITEFCKENNLGAKKTMQVSLALEEMLTVIITYCMDPKKKQFIDIRILCLEEDVLLRIRNTGRIFDPVRYYEENKDNEDMAESVLGIKMIAGSAKEITFHETFGTNNLLIRF